MSLAHLLLRQARQRADSPAILNGTALHATHGQWAARCGGHGGAPARRGAAAR